MKKSLAIILAVVLVCAVLVVTAVAGGSASPTQQGVTAAGEAADIVITNALEAEDADPAIVEHLEIAKEELEENADDLSKLCPELAEVENFGDYAVLDVLYISWGEETQKIVDAKGSVEVSLETKLNPGSMLKVLFNEVANGEWVLMDEENVKVEDDGSTALKVSEEGVYALLVKEA